MKNYYRVLELGNFATQDAIRTNYRKLAKKYHPDMNPDDPFASGRFQQIQEAYDFLMDDYNRETLNSYLRGEILDTSFAQGNKAYQQQAQQRHYQYKEEKRRPDNSAFLRSFGFLIAFIIFNALRNSHDKPTYVTSTYDQPEVVASVDSLGQMDALQPDFFVPAEVLPSFPGDIRQYLKEHIEYPPAALLAAVDGTVYVKFSVDTAGHLHNIRVGKGVNPALNQEALRVVQAMPDWIPGKRKGIYTVVDFTLPVVFKIEKVKM